MKKGIVILLAVLFLASSVALADTTSGAEYNSAWKNSILAHDHEYTDRNDVTSQFKSPIGVGVDLTLYETDVFSIPTAFGLDGQYDFNNARWGVMAKVSLNLSDTVKALLGQK